MRFGISTPPGGDAGELVELAQLADRTGWDGFFLWDHVYIADGWVLHDPWVLLGAMAVVTRRVLLGAMVTPLARRRPWKVAKEVTTLDHLSHGRAVVGVGLGVPDTEFTAFGEEAVDRRERGAALDEGLVLLDAFLRGDEVVHDGARHHVRARLTPQPVQRPRPPIWVAASWPHRRPLERAARFEGVFPLGRNNEGGLTLEQTRQVRAVVGPAAEIVLPHDPAIPVSEYAAAGATWLIVGPDAPGDDVRAKIAAGPPS